MLSVYVFVIRPPRYNYIIPHQVILINQMVDQMIELNELKGKK